eukprot:13678-Heterococcus_DN1.PRE.3
MPADMRPLHTQRNPLHDPVLCEQVLSFIDSREGLYILTVNSSWKAYYQQRVSQQLEADDEGEQGHMHVHTTRCTSYEAVSGSESRLLLAYELGFRIPTSDDDIHELHKWVGQTCCMNTLKMLAATGFEWSEEVARGIAIGNDIPKMQWLTADCGVALPDDISLYAVQEGSLPMLHWLREHGGTLTEDTMLEAIMHNNNDDVRQYLIDYGFPLNERLCTSAAENGDAEALRSLRKAGCPWNVDDVLFQATADQSDRDYYKDHNPSIELLYYMLEEGVFNDISLLDKGLKLAGINGNVGSATWFRQHGAHWPAVLRDVTGKQWPNPTLRWARSEGCTVSPEIKTVRAAAPLIVDSPHTIMNNVYMMILHDAAQMMAPAD